MSNQPFRPSICRVQDTVFASGPNDPGYVYVAITAGLSDNIPLNTGNGNVLRITLVNLNLINTTAPTILVKTGGSTDSVAALPASKGTGSKGARVILQNTPFLLRIPPNHSHLHFREITGGVGSLIVEYCYMPDAT